MNVNFSESQHQEGQEMDGAASLESQYAQLSIQEMNSTDRIALLKHMKSLLRAENIEETAQEMMSADRLNLLLSVVQSEDCTVEEKGLALDTLANIAAISSVTPVLVGNGLIEILIQYLASGSASQDQTTKKQAKTYESAVWALGNLAGEDNATGLAVLEFGALNVLFQQILVPFQKCKPLMRVTMWTLSNLTRCMPKSLISGYEDLVVFVANLMMNLNDDQITVDALWIMTRVTEHSETCVKRLLSIPGFLEFVVKCIEPEIQPLKALPATRAIGNISLGDDATTQCLVDAGAIEALVASLENHSSSIMRKETCWALSNLLCGNPAQTQRCVAAGALSAITSIVCKESDPVVLKEACWCIANAFECANLETLPLIIEVSDMLPALVFALGTSEPSLKEHTIRAALKLVEYGSTLAAPNPFIVYLFPYARELFEEAAEEGSLEAARILNHFPAQ